MIYQSKNSKNLYAEAEKVFTDRIGKYIKFESVRLTPLKLSSSLNANQVRQKEMEYFISKLPSGARVFLLDEKGKLQDSRSFSGWLDNQISYDSRDICFVIGGAYGFSEEFRKRAQGVISLSKLTMAHHLARIVFLEQLYRAFSIINGEPYHND